MTSRFMPQTLALFSGLLLTFSYPPYDMFFMAWGAWIPLWAALQQNKYQQGFKLGYITGFMFTLTSLNWIANNSGTSFLIASASMIGAVAYLSLWFGLFGLILSRLGQKIGSDAFWLAPIFWVSIEYMYSYQDLVLSFPWLNMALTQNFALPVLQLAEYGGIYLISFWVMLINTVLFQLEFGRLSVRVQQLVWGVLGFALVGTFVFGAVRMKVVGESATDSMRVAVIQNNLDPHQKWVRSKKTTHVQNIMRQTQMALEDSAELFIWPESAVPAHLKYYRQFDRQLRNYVEQNDVSILTGALHHTREGEAYTYYNSAFYYTPGMPASIYSKMGLVPFAERLPLVEQFPALKNLNFGQANFEAGTEALVHPMGTREHVTDLGTVICYESANPFIFRQFMTNGADLMAIITNDAWLGTSPGPYQHLAAGRLRAIEHRVSVVRAAQTGISAIILPSGRILDRIPLNQKGELVEAVPLGLNRTFYSRHGNVFALVIVLLASGGLLYTVMAKRRVS